jgi:acetylornithine/N-succinyldiaminopimelate aminotransferase
MGLMQGLVCKGPVSEILSKALDKGLILINAGTDIIRFVPPLIITKEDVDRMVEILDQCLA